VARPGQDPDRTPRGQAEAVLRILTTLFAIVVEIAGFLVAGAAVLTGLAAWRLASGPIEVEALKPMIENTAAEYGFDLSVGSTALRWYGFDQPVAVVARDVVLRGTSGEPVARFAEAAADLDVPDLLRGEIEPLAIALIRPRVTVIRTAEGDFAFDVADREAEAVGTDAAAPGGDAGIDTAFVRSLLAGLDPGHGAAGPLGKLVRFQVVAGAILLDDRLTGRRWRLPTTDIDLHRDAAGISGRVSTEVAIGGRRPRLSGQLQFDSSTRQLFATVAFEGVVPADFTSAAAFLAPLDSIRSPLSGRIDLAFDRRFRIETARFLVEGQATRLSVAPMLSSELTAASMRLTGSVEPQRRVLNIDSAEIDLGGPVIFLTARAEEAADIVELFGTAAIETMPLDLVGTYWPPEIAPGARRWIAANMRTGVVNSALFGFHVRGPAAALDDVAMVSLDGTVDLAGATITYLDGLPPLLGVDGHAAFDKAVFRARIGSGAVDDVTLLPTTAVITGLDLPDQAIDLDVAITGPVAETLAILDAPRLGYARKLGIAPGRTGGDMSGRLRMRFLLENDLRFDGVALAASANLHDLVIDDLAPGYRLSRGGLALTLDGTGLRGRGVVRLNDVPFEIEGVQRFDDTSVSARLDFRARLDAEARRALAIPPIDALDGTVGLRASVEEWRGGDTVLEGRLDLSDASLRFEAIDWRKPVGPDSELTARINIRDGRPHSIRDIVFDAPGLAVRGGVAFDGRGGLGLVTIDSFRHGRTDLSGTVALDGSDRLNASLEGRALDVSPMLQGGREDREARTATADGPSYDVSLDIDQVILGGDRSLASVNGTIRGRGDSIDGGGLSGRLSGGGSVDMRIGPSPAAAGQQTISLTTDNAGNLLRAFDVTDTVERGKLVLQGTRTGGPGGPVAGHVDASDLVFVDAPGMAKLLAATSPGGLADLFATTGLTFDRASADVAYDPRRRSVVLRQGQAAGGDLGITFDGRLDLAAETVDIAGTIVPIYHVNRLIGAIPLIGDILTGGNDGGLFAATYTVTGSFQDPQVDVNPLSALAPGFLRRLFFEATPSEN
jgi:hypothetical protein